MVRWTCCQTAAASEAARQIGPACAADTGVLNTHAASAGSLQPRSSDGNVGVCPTRWSIGVLIQPGEFHASGG